MTFRELLSEFEQVTYPITLVCAGNRRKEQNVVRKSKGFSWGPAGVSTAVWTGVSMSEVLRRTKPKRKAKYVCMEGADKLVSAGIGKRESLSLLIVKAEWVLRNVCEVKLGLGSQPRHDVGSQNEW